MANTHTRKPDRILTEESQKTLSKIYSFIQHALIGSFLSYTIFRILNMLTYDSFRYLNNTDIDAGFFWIFCGALIGLLIRKLLPLHDMHS
jgi:hypothetical protein